MKINSLSSVCTAALFSAAFAGGCPQGNTDSGSPAPSRQTSTAVSQTAVVADTVVFVQSEPSAPKRSDEPSEPKKAGAGDWSSDDIQRDPYGFIQEQIRDCDRLKAKIEAQKISLTRLGKQSARTIEESDGTVARYTAFLAEAKKAYKEAEAADKWPAVVNGFELDEDSLSSAGAASSAAPPSAGAAGVSAFSLLTQPVIDSTMAALIASAINFFIFFIPLSSLDSTQ